MKVGLIYTGTTKELIRTVETEVRAQLGNTAELLHYQDASILARVREAGHVTAQSAADLTVLFLQAVRDGAQALLNVCSSVGEVADSLQDFAKYIGVPIIRIDEEMCREAVRKGTRIAVMATLPTTLLPTKHTLRRVAREMGRRIELMDVLVQGAFGLSSDALETLLIQHAAKVCGGVDAILFAQASMAFCEATIAERVAVPVFCSPRFGARALRAALAAKGAL